MNLAGLYLDNHTAVAIEPPAITIVSIGKDSIGIFYLLHPSCHIMTCYILSSFSI